MELLVLTVSDRASKGIYEDRSGPALELLLRSSFPSSIIHLAVVPDEQPEIIAAFVKFAQCDFIITTGGTGISPRDVTPDATASWCDRLIPGIAEYLRTASMQQTPHAVFSRAVAGVKGKTIVVNVPGSVRGAIFCVELLVPLMEHAVKMLAGGGHE